MSTNNRTAGTTGLSIQIADELCDIADGPETFEEIASQEMYRLLAKSNGRKNRDAHD